jgi:hypothetical protein
MMDPPKDAQATQETSAPTPLPVLRRIAALTVAAGVVAVLCLALAQALLAAEVAGAERVRVTGMALLLAIPVVRSAGVLVWGRGAQRALAVLVVALLLAVYAFTHLF